jgi:hypothetical protein
VFAHDGPARGLNLSAGKDRTGAEGDGNHKSPFADKINMRGRALNLNATVMPTDFGQGSSA